MSRDSTRRTIMISPYRRLCKGGAVSLRATLFDMDGLLLDSEILWHKAEVEIFGSLGVPLSDAMGRSTKGMYVNQVVTYWNTQYPWEGRASHRGRPAARARRRARRERRRLMPGAMRALDLTSARGPLGLASSTPMALIVRCLKHFGLLDRFAAIHSAELEPFGKPHPGCVLERRCVTRRAPKACLVFEDSAAGVVGGQVGDDDGGGRSHAR